MFRVLASRYPTLSRLTTSPCEHHVTTSPCKHHVTNPARVRSFSSGATEKYDIVIVGGGMIGAAAAVALGIEERMEHKRILVLDQQTGTNTFTPDSPHNIRVINLTVGNAAFLADIGVWERVRAMRSHSYNRIYCWESNSNHTISFSGDPMGFIIENNIIELAMAEVAENLHNVEVRKGVKVQDIKLPQEPKINPVELRLDSGHVIEADLLIGADGANSFVRRTMDVPVLSWNYEQQGIVCTLRSSSPDCDDVAYQRFLNTGPIALLPLGQGFFSLVWSCRNNLAQELMSLSSEQFVDRINNALQKDATLPDVVTVMENIAERLNVLEKPPRTPVITEIEGPRGKFPLGFSHSARCVGARAVLLGDAAHRVHPLAGQGANIGFRGVQQLCREIARNPDSELGDNGVLTSFETKLQRQITPMLVFVDGMNKLYGTSAEPVVAARSFGVGLVNKFSSLKNIFMLNARE